MPGILTTTTRSKWLFHAVHKYSSRATEHFCRHYCGSRYSVLNCTGPSSLAGSSSVSRCWLAARLVPHPHPCHMHWLLFYPLRDKRNRKTKLAHFVLKSHTAAVIYNRTEEKTNTNLVFLSLRGHKTYTVYTIQYRSIPRLTTSKETWSRVRQVHLHRRQQQHQLLLLALWTGSDGTVELLECLLAVVVVVVAEVSWGPSQITWWWCSWFFFSLSVGYLMKQQQQPHQVPLLEEVTYGTAHHYSTL